MTSPWEHITHEDIENYHRERYEVKRKEAERRLSDPRSRLTPEQEADIRAMLDEMQRATDESDRRAAAKAMKKAKKAAKKAAAAKAAALNGNTGSNAANGNIADKNNGNIADKNNGNNAAIDTGNADVDPATLPPAARGARAVANALARHPNVDLDTALENHYATAGIPKENLTHEQIYDAITAEANFQKRQAIIQNRLRRKTSDAGAEDNDPPKTRSP